MGNDLLEVGAPWYAQGEHGGLWPLNIHTNAYAKSLIVKTGPGKLYGFTVYNSGAAQFIQVFDGTTVPVNGSIPAVVLSATATAAIGAFYGDVGRTFNAGCVIVNSSTGPTLTIGAADIWIDAQYI